MLAQQCEGTNCQGRLTLRWLVLCYVNFTPLERQGMCPMTGAPVPLPLSPSSLRLAERLFCLRQQHRPYVDLPATALQ